jgi:hypothetical protein
LPGIKERRRIKMETALTIPKVNTKEIESQTMTFVKEAKEVKIASQKSYEAAGELRKAATKLEKYIEQKFKPSKDALNLAKTELMALIKSQLKPVQYAKEILDDKIMAYVRKLRVEQEKKQKEAEEKTRKEAEEKRKKQIEEAKEGGVSKEELEIIESIPVEAPAPQIKDKTKLAGLATRDNWKYKITDKDKLKAFLYENMPDLLLVDEIALGKMVRATKGSVRYPGMTTYNDERPAGTR